MAEHTMNTLSTTKSLCTILRCYCMFALPCMARPVRERPTRQCARRLLYHCCSCMACMLLAISIRVASLLLGFAP